MKTELSRPLVPTPEEWRRMTMDERINSALAYLVEEGELEPAVVRGEPGYRLTELGKRRS